MANIYYVLAFLAIFQSSSSHAKQCLNADPCSCIIDEFRFLTLGQLVPPQNNFFQDGLGNFSYFFSGCKDADFKPAEFQLIANKTFKAVSLVKCTSGLQEVNNSILIDQTCTPIGHSKDITFDLKMNSETVEAYTLIYANSTTKTLPTIQLVCSTFNSSNLKIVNAESNTLVLYSPLVCLHYNTPNQLSGGSVFCIIFIVAFIIYFFGGAVLMYFARGARGVEVIPNYDFWASLPGLIKDGLTFILSGCQPFSVTTAETYDRI